MRKNHGEETTQQQKKACLEAKSQHKIEDLQMFQYSANTLANGQMQPTKEIRCSSSTTSYPKSYDQKNCSDDRNVSYNKVLNVELSVFAYRTVLRFLQVNCFNRPHKETWPCPPVPAYNIVRLLHLI